MESAFRVARSSRVVPFAAALFALFQAAGALAQPAETLTEIRRTPDGLFLAGVTSPPPALLSEPAPEGIRRVVVVLRGAALGDVPREIAVEDELVVRVRVVRYREGEESGVKLRIDLRGYPPVEMSARVGGLFLRIGARPEPAQSESPRRVGRGAPGVFTYLGNLASSKTSDGAATTSLTNDVALGQLLPGLFTLEGHFVWAEADGRQTYLRYSGIARGYDLGWATASVGLGDVVIRFGGAGGVATNVAESLDMRGGALRLSGPLGGVMEVFGGEARGAPFLVRDGQNLVVSSQFSGDDVAGLVLSLPLPVDRRFRLGAGWAHTFTAGGPDRDNVFAEVGFVPGRLFDAGLRFGYVSGTRPDGSRLSGTLLGIQSHFTLSWADVSGTYRDRSAGYVAPGGNQEFPGEKGSSLYATVRPIQNLTVLATLSESQSFPFQQLDVGPVTSRTTSAGIDYALGKSSLLFSWSRLTQKSTGDALNPSDSSSEVLGLTLGTVLLGQSLSAGVGRERTSNFINPALDLESTVVNVSAGFSMTPRLGATLNGRWADTKQIATGDRLDDYGADLSVYWSTGATSLSLSGFAARTPAGSALYSAERLGGTAGISTRLPADFLVTATASFARISLSSGDRVDNRSVAINLNKTFNWGAGTIPGPVGIWDSGEAVSPILASAIVSGRVYVDLNLNGRFDPGEPPVPGVVVQAGAIPATTDAEGRYRIVVEPGAHVLRVLAASVPFSYQVEGAETRNLVLGPRHHIEQDVPLYSSGILEGRLVARPGGGAENESLGGIRLNLAYGERKRSAVSEADGSFRFAGVPPGNYRLSVDEEDLGEALAVEGPNEREIRVEAEGAATVTFEIRRLSTRERLERRRKSD